MRDVSPGKLGGWYAITAIRRAAIVGLYGDRASEGADNGSVPGTPVVHPRHRLSTHSKQLEACGPQPVGSGRRSSAASLLEATVSWRKRAWHGDCCKHPSVCNYNTNGRGYGRSMAVWRRHRHVVGGFSSRPKSHRPSLRATGGTSWCNAAGGIHGRCYWWHVPDYRLAVAVVAIRKLRSQPTATPPRPASTPPPLLGIPYQTQTFVATASITALAPGCTYSPPGAGWTWATPPPTQYRA